MNEFNTICEILEQLLVEANAVSLLLIFSQRIQVLVD